MSLNAKPCRLHKTNLNSFLKLSVTVLFQPSDSRRLTMIRLHSCTVKRLLPTPGVRHPAPRIDCAEASRRGVAHSLLERSDRSGRSSPVLAFESSQGAARVLVDRSYIPVRTDSPLRSVGLRTPRGNRRRLRWALVVPRSPGNL